MLRFCLEQMSDVPLCPARDITRSSLFTSFTSCGKSTMWGTVLSRLRSACTVSLTRSIEVPGPLRPTTHGVSHFHSLSNPIKGSPLANQCSVQALTRTSLLQARLVPLLSLVSGFKVKGRLKRRCKDCYFVMRQERLYVICKTHPRHKQMSMKKHEHNTWILTDATQGKVRAW